MNGKATPWEEMEDDEEPLDDLEMETEMEQITLDITELVDCLLRLSVSIQNPAPHDRFMSSTFTDASAYEDFDIQHVQAKFQDIDESLAQRLGKAMSRRRQYFKYREAHHQKLSHDDLAKAKLPHAKIPEGFDSGKTVEALFSTSEKNITIHGTSSDVESSHSIEFSGDIPAEDDQAFTSVGRVTDIDASLQKANIVRDLAVQNGREAEEDEDIETGILHEIYEGDMSWESSDGAHAIDNSESKQIEPAARSSLDHSAVGLMGSSSLFDRKSTAFGADVLDYFVSSERLSQEHGQALERNRPSSAMGIITTSHSLSASASYDKPSPEDFREKSDSPTNYEKQFNSVVPSLQRHQSFDTSSTNSSTPDSGSTAGKTSGANTPSKAPKFMQQISLGLRGFSVAAPKVVAAAATFETVSVEQSVTSSTTPLVISTIPRPLSPQVIKPTLSITPGLFQSDSRDTLKDLPSTPSDKGNRLAQRTLRRASNDSFGFVTSTSRGLTEDRLKSLSIDAGPGNKRRASSPPDADEIPDSASLKSEPVTSETRAGSSQVLSAEALGEDTEADDKRTKAKVLYNFIGKTPNELTVESNDLVDILHQGDKARTFRDEVEAESLCQHNIHNKPYHSEILMMQALSSP
ncbi:Myosin-1 [Colletotrichum sp. SAR 10_70]|nr:Myosin-1 [Colletotrichum sp. SAR 10_71]KAI8170413.1 Myosin-1 [Colletotrichum sp. SAR 10_70]KAI8192643.1 Myosin-1 [Colletotrichum sp. SAR 10_75]KAI8247642.1 Myosin-1 [Colletotrichum sp. SAR 10_77]